MLLVKRDTALVRELQRLADSTEPLIARRANEMLRALRLRPEIIDAMTEAIASGDLDQAVRIASANLPVVEAAMVAEPLTRAFTTAAGLSSADYFGTSFTMEAPRAERWARRYSSGLVTMVDEQTRQNIRDIVATAISVGPGDFRERRLAGRGLAPREQARLISQVVGLDARRARQLDRIAESLVEGGASGDVLNRRLERARTRLIRQRALVIARTETMRSLNEGQRESWIAAADEGLFDPAVAQVEWITGRDERVCRICSPLEGHIIPYGESFPGGLRPGFAHPQCRCTDQLWPEGGKELTDPQPEVESVEPEWRPTMTRTEADAWAGDSVITDDQFHTTGFGDEIRRDGFRPSRRSMFGDGVYTTSSLRQAELWEGHALATARRGGRESIENLTIRAKVKNVVRWVDAPETPGAIAHAVGMVDRLGRSGVTAGHRRWFDWAERRGLTEHMRGLSDAITNRGKGVMPGTAEADYWRSVGVDALSVEFTGSSVTSYASGGSQLVVFDPMNVVVISG